MHVLGLTSYGLPGSWNRLDVCWAQQEPGKEHFVYSVDLVCVFIFLPLTYSKYFLSLYAVCL